MRSIVAAVMTLLSLLILAPRASAETCPHFVGTWSTTFGPTTFQRPGRHKTTTHALFGTYVYDQSRYLVNGTEHGRTFKGRWSHPTGTAQSNQSGTVNLTLSADQSKFSGSWRWANGTPGGPWTGTCLHSP